MSQENFALSFEQPNLVALSLPSNLQMSASVAAELFVRGAFPLPVRADPRQDIVSSPAHTRKGGLAF